MMVIIEAKTYMGIVRSCAFALEYPSPLMTVGTVAVKLRDKVSGGSPVQPGQHRSLVLYVPVYTDCVSPEYNDSGPHLPIR